MDRQDIDALLIGALYGELTPADEARLTAHLESHPGDRGALDDLKVARAAVRESRIFELQHEPPQAVSALLLQEAHRRAPKRVVSSTGEEQESWFFRFTRMFMAHPAMAAAAMLVVVVGVFGVMRANDRNASEVAEKTYSPSAQMETADQSITNEAIVAPTGAAEPAAGSAAAVAMDPSESAPADEGKDGYNVQLDETTRGRRDSFLADREQAKVAKESEKLQREQQANKKSKGMIVTTPQPQPKELDAPRPKTATTKAPAKSSTLAKGDSADDFDYAVGATGGAGGAAAPRTGTAAGASAPRAGAGAGISANDSGLAAPQGKFAQPAAPPAAAPAPPPPSVATAPSTTSKPTEAKQAQQRPADAKAESAAPAQTKDNSLIAWAKSEHNRTVALANKGDCIAAAKLAVVVQNRAPDYYTQYMSTDRALKRCQAYIAQERDAEAERTGKARAQKRVNADEPAPATK
jgi:hypothetical protein